MSNNTISDTSDKLINQVSHSADAAIHATQRVTNEALEGLLHTVDTARQQIVPISEKCDSPAMAEPRLSSAPSAS